MRLFNRSFRFASLLLIGLAVTAPARAADYLYPPPPPPPPSLEAVGVACDVGWSGWYTWLPAYWSSVWMGHFSGGFAQYRRQAGVVALVWNDQKRCFPTYGACMRWVSALRREFHRPEGYWTCMPLR